MADIDYRKLSMDEIVFEKRNKSYGAFELRKLIDRHKLTGLLVAVGFFTLVVLASQFKLFSLISKLTEEKEVNIEMTNVDLPPPPPPPPVDAPPPPPPPPPPVRPTIKFVELIAKKDEEVQEQQVTKQEEIKETAVSTETVKGDENAKAIISEPTTGTGTGVVKEPEPVAPKEPEIFDRAEVQPSYPGGPQAMMKYLANNIRYPSLARENNLEGKVVVKFTVDRDGSIKDPVVLKDGVGGGCADEAIRVIKSMPKWTPGLQRGNPVKVYFTLPVSFKLSQ
jgi:protein TonB